MNHQVELIQFIQNPMPPGLAAGSQTCNAQAAGDDSDDLTKSEKLVI
ncbi:hypothetical protein [Calothrix sp. NIES-2100]